MKRTSWCLVCLCSVTICAGRDKENLGHILDRLIANLQFPSTGRATYQIEECDAWSQAARVLRCKYVFTGSLYGFEVVTLRPNSSLGDLNVRSYFDGQETISWIHREKVATIWEGRRGQTPIYRLQRFCPTEILKELLGRELELKGSCDINGIPCSLLECVVSSKDRIKVWVTKEPDVYPLRIERYEYDNLRYVYESENVKYWRRVLFPEKISIGWYRPDETWEHSLISSYVVTIESFVPNIQVAPAEFKPELPAETAVNKRPLSQAPAAAFKPTLPVRRLRRLDDLQIDFNLDQAKGRMILLCFFDPNQRPSRHLVAELAKRAEELRDKGLTLVGVQASKVDKKELNDWVKKYNISFPVGMVKDDLEGIKAKWRVHSLPWLILTDRQHIVLAEGFDLEELDKVLDQFFHTDREGSKHAPATHFQPDNKREPSTKTASLEVRVTYRQDGTLIEGARVSFTNKATGQSFRIETAADGVACIDVEPGDYAMTNVSKEGYRSHKRDVQMAPVMGKVDHIDIELADAPKVTGYVRDQNGKPFPGTSVHMVPYGPTGVVTDATGKFEFKWDPRGIQLFLVARHVELALAGSVEFHNRYGGPVYQEGDIVEISLDTGLTLAGLVTDANGSGLAGANVAARLPVGGGPTPVAEAKTDPNGHYGIKALPLGHQYRLEITCDGYGPQTIEGWGEIVAGTIETVGTVKLNEAGLSVSGVVVDANGNPVDAAEVRCWGSGQPEHQTKTDANGQFLIEGVCQGNLRIQARKERLSGVIDTEGGSQNVKIIPAKSKGFVFRRPRPKSAQLPTSLVGKALPDLKDLRVELGPPDAKDKIVLLCFFDMNQRPSRNCMGKLAERAEELEQKGVILVTIQASKVDEEALTEWLKKNNISFPVGSVRGDEEKIRFAWGVRSLPWLILTDKQHVVTAEGFSVAELVDKLKGAADSRKAVEESEIEVSRSKDSSGWKNNFERVYRLSQGEVLKRIAPPFIPERREYLAEEMPRYYTPGQAEPLPAVIFQWDGHLTRSGWSCSAGYSLAAVLQAVIGLEYYEFELAPKLQYLLLKGDWIVRKDSTVEDRLKAFELILKNQIGKEIRFARRRVSRPLIIATGSFRFHPLSGTYDDSWLHFFAEALDPARPAHQREHHTLRSANSVPSEVGRLAGLQVINQTDPSDETMVRCSFHRSAYLAGVKDEGQGNRKLSLLLANVTSQTGLKFAIKRQPAELWSVTELKGSEDGSAN